MVNHQGFVERRLARALSGAEKVFKASGVRSLAEGVWETILHHPFTSAAVFSIPFFLARWLLRASSGKASPFYTLMVAGVLTVCAVGLEVRSNPKELLSESKLGVLAAR